MSRWTGPLVILVIAAFAAHWATLALAPGIIMDRALATLKDRGIAEHAFTTPRRITPQTQAVVRSSPDLFYSLCRYDLSDPDSALEVTMGEWPDYQSLSFFDEETNNFATYRAEGKRQVVRLYSPGQLAGSISKGRVPPVGETWQNSPSERGVVLIRRLAPTQGQFDAAKDASASDSCELIAL